jgi:transposase InsO family protein
MDITGPYPLTPRRNKYLLTFVDHLSKYAEAFAIPEQTAEVCARVYAREIVTSHGTVSDLVTEQSSAFMFSFFSETCKVLGFQKIHISSYHPESNGLAERWHWTLHTSLSHLVNNSHTN